MTVWQVWHNVANEHKTRRVVGFVPGYGVFDIRQGVIYRLFGGTPKELGTARPATPGELAELDWAAAHGCLQIEIRPVTGVCGSGVASGQSPTEITWQARGV
jgi:hypothetical protein